MNIAKTTVLVLIPPILSGCLSTSPAEHTDWNIECSEAALRVAAKPKFGVARLSLVEMRAPYTVREMAVLRANGSVAFDQCNAYAASPVQLVKGVALESLSRSGLFKAVVGASSSADSDIEVEVAVTRLALDSREKDSLRAVAVLSVRLVSARKISAYVTGSGSADASGHDFSAAFSSAVTSAFSDALGKL